MLCGLGGLFKAVEVLFVSGITDYHHPPTTGIKYITIWAPAGALEVYVGLGHVIFQKICSDNSLTSCKAV